MSSFGKYVAAIPIAIAIHLICIGAMVAFFAAFDANNFTEFTSLWLVGVTTGLIFAAFAETIVHLLFLWGAHSAKIEYKPTTFQLARHLVAYVGGMEKWNTLKRDGGQQT